MKAGDLVKVKNDPDSWLGHGVVLEMRGSSGSRQIKVRWFDDFTDAPIDWNTEWCLEILSESR